MYVLALVFILMYEIPLQVSRFVECGLFAFFTLESKMGLDLFELFHSLIEVCVFVSCCRY